LTRTEQTRQFAIRPTPSGWNPAFVSAGVKIATNAAPEFPFIAFSRGFSLCRFPYHFGLIAIAYQSEHRFGARETDEYLYEIRVQTQGRAF
jgi:hypothetical protein